MSQKYVCNGDSCVLVDTIKPKTTSTLPTPNPKDQWTIYGTESCSYCTKAKDLLKSKKKSYVYIDVNDYVDGRKTLIAMTKGHKTVPAIYMKDQFIGGYTDLCKLEI